MDGAARALSTLEDFKHAINRGMTLDQIKMCTITGTPKHIIEDMFNIALRELDFEKHIKPTQAGKLLYD